MRIAIDQYQNRTGMEANMGAWMIVDDVIFTGDWKDLLDNYTLSAVHSQDNEGGGGTLISSEDRAYTTDDIRVSWWTRFSSPQFKQTYVDSANRNNVVWKQTEQVVFYSNRFLEVLNDNMRRGMHAQSEVGTPTICEWNDCRRINIERKFIDNDQFYSNSNDEHTIPEIKARLEYLKDNGLTKLVHPCKW